MLRLLIILLLVAHSKTHILQDTKTSNTQPSSSAPIIPNHVRIQHMDVNIHPDIVIDVQTPHFS
jgi:hypothetical protein